MYEAAFAAIKRELAVGNIICIFPEGRLTKDGEIDQFRAGIERIIAESPVPVVPMALQGLWGSFFSHQGSGAFKIKGRIWSRVKLHVGAIVAAEHVSAALLELQVKQLRGEQR